MTQLYLVDSHCHLDFPEFASDTAAVVERARAAGVGHMLTIGTKITKFDGVLAVAERFDNVSCSVGIHPHEAGTEPAMDVEKLTTLAKPSISNFWNFEKCTHCSNPTDDRLGGCQQ